MKSKRASELKRPAPIRSSDGLGGAIAKLKAELAEKIKQRKEAKAAAKKDSRKLHIKACAKKDKPHQVSATIWCLEASYQDGTWGHWITLSESSPKTYREALNYLRAKEPEMGQGWKLPNGKLDMTRWRIMRYHAVRDALVPTYRLEQKHYDEPATQPPNAQAH